VSKKPAKKPGKKGKDKPKKLTIAERALKLAEELKGSLDGLRTEVHGISINVNKSMKSFNDAFSTNDKTLCDYIDEVADKLHGIARAYREHSAVQAQVAEDHEQRLRLLEAQLAGDGRTAEEVPKGWAPVITDEMLLKCANSARVERVEAQKKRLEEAERLKAAQEKVAKEAAERDSMKLDELNDKELTEATAAAAEGVAAGYAEGTQFFGEDED